MLGRIAESKASEGVRRVVKGIGQKLKSIHPLQKKNTRWLTPICELIRSYKHSYN